MDKLALLLPTLLRYGLMILTGRLLAGGLISAEIADEINTNADLLNGLAAMVTGGLTLVWFLWSRAWAAIKARFDPDGDGRWGTPT